MNINIHSDVPEGYYGKLASAWLKNDKNLRDIYPVDEANINSLQEQYAGFNSNKRERLFGILTKQYEGIELHANVSANLEKIRHDNTFTVTTGQQIHIFLGPAFFIYKIAAVIRQAKRLQAENPDNYYIPVFWMASEDHDVAEINNVTVFGKKYTWDTAEHGPTGRFSTKGLEVICDDLMGLVDKENVSSEIHDVLKVFKEAYTRFSTLSMSTRYILNELFGKYGLVIIDADHDLLKTELQSLIHNDLFSESVFDSLQTASASLKAIGFGNQVNPRKTHFFMIKDEDRLRIDREGDGFKLHPTGEFISKNNMMLLAAEKPHVFSPNALLRPLYQQLILPNVAYVSGPAELHYWHQLFPLFKKELVVAPILILRDSFLFLDNKTLDFLQKYNLVESVVWKGFEVSSICLENVLIGENKLSQEIEELKNKTEIVFQTLFGLKYKNIKELRTQNKVWIKVLQKAVKSVLNDVRKQTAFEPVFNKLQKISSLYFDKNNPQERSLSWLELLLKTRNIPIDFFFDIPLSGHTFGTLSV